MSLPECLNDKNPRDLDTTQIAEHFLQFKFNKDIQKVILEKKLDGQAILDAAKGDLMDILGLEDTDDKTQFVKLRVALRKADFSKREKINLDEINVINLSYDGVCQLFDEQISAKDENQRLKWYSYLEDETIDGEVLLAIDSDDFIKDLEFTKGQIKKFETLLEKMKGGSAQSKGTINVSNNKSTIGVQSTVTGNAKINYMLLSMLELRQKNKRRKKEKKGEKRRKKD